MAKPTRFFKTEKVVQWKEVTDEVNRRLKSDYSRNYIQNVYHDNLRSEKIKQELDDILKGV